MNEVISSILEAEAKAAEIVAAGADSARACLLSGEEKAEAIREQAIVEFKAERKQKIAAAEEKAESLYDKKISEGKAAGEALKADCKGKLGAAAEKIVGRLIG